MAGIGPGIVSRALKAVAPRLLKAAAPSNFEKALIPIQGVLANRGGAAGEAIAVGLRESRNLSRRAHGNILRVAEPIIKSFTPAERAELSAGLMGAPVAGKAGAVIQGINPLLQITKQTPQKIIQEAQQRGMRLSPKAMQDGEQLLNLVVSSNEELLTRHLVGTQVKPMIAQLPQELQSFGERAISNVMTHSGGSGGLSTLRAFNVATLMGRAVILNSSQGVLSAVTAGLGSTARAARTFTSSVGREQAREFGLRIGEAFDGAISDFLRHDLGQGRMYRAARGLLKVTGHQAAERFNRRFAGQVGKELYADLTRDVRLGNQRAAVLLKRFGVSSATVQAGQDTPDDLYRFAQNFVRETQFRTTAEELPLLASDPVAGEWWRTIMQFKTFNLKAAELLLRDAETNPRAFFRAPLMLPVAGAPVAFARRKTARPQESAIEEIQQHPGRFAADSLFSVSNAGMFYDAWQSGQFGKQGLYDFVGGPSTSLVTEAGAAIHSLADPTTPAGKPRSLKARIAPGARLLASRVPIAGPALKRDVSERLRSQRGRGSAARRLGITPLR